VIALLEHIVNILASNISDFSNLALKDPSLEARRDEPAAIEVCQNVRCMFYFREDLSVALGAEDQRPTLY
jgi:hypothetical protein